MQELMSRRLRCVRRLRRELMMGIAMKLAHLVLQGGLIRPAKRKWKHTTPCTWNTARGVRTVEPDGEYRCSIDIARMWMSHTSASRGRWTTAL